MPRPSLTLSLPHVPPRQHSRADRWFIRLLLALILVSLALIVYPFWPEAHYQLRRALPAGIGRSPTSVSTQAAEPRAGRWLEIPAIGVNTPVVEGSDVGILDQTEGIWHQVGQPGNGNLVLAGHRFKYLPPNTTTFYHLDKLAEGDTIILWWDNAPHTYAVEQSFEVKPGRTEILNPTTHEQLTLYTCTDLAASRRLVVIATPIPPKAP